MSTPGLGHPVDALDKLCQQWKQCQRCAIAEHGEWCTNEQTQYGIKVRILQDSYQAKCSVGIIFLVHSLYEPGAEHA